jgi:hypothetical protein
MMAEITPSISRGMLVDCILKVDEDKRSIDVRRAKVFRVDPKGVIISQTNPAIPASAKGSKLVVTFLDAKNHRMGFTAVISQITTEYQLTAEHKVGAILLTNFTEEKQQNLRMAFRVRLAENTDMTLYNSQKEALEVLDLSGSGARFSHDLKNEYKVGQQIKLYLGYERVFYELKAQVVRKGDPSGAEVKNREQVAVKFLDLDLRTEGAIYKIVRSIEVRKASTA